MSENDPLGIPEPKPKPPVSLARKLGLGAALIAVPIGAALTYMKLSDDSETRSDKITNFNPFQYANIDPALIGYEKVRDIATGLHDTQAIAVDANGRLLVAGDHCIRIISPSSESPADIKLPETPTALVVSDIGQLIVGFHNHVEIYNADGTQAKAWKPLDSAAIITGLAVHGADVYVADSGNKVVLHCDQQGTIINTIRGHDASGFILPSPHLTVAAMADGNVLIANPGRLRMETYGSDGKFIGTIAEVGVGLAKFEGCCNPSNIAIMADGRIVTAEKGIARVKVYRADGNLDCVVAGPDIFGQSTTGLQLAVDGHHQVWVMEPGSTTVRVFAPKKAGTL